MMGPLEDEAAEKAQGWTSWKDYHAPGKSQIIEYSDSTESNIHKPSAAFMETDDQENPEKM